MIKQFLEVGQIVGTHGIRGEVRVNPWTDSPEFLKKFKKLYYDPNGEKEIKIISARPHGNIVILKIDGIDTVDKASLLRSKKLYIRRSDANISPNSYFIDELIGCTVFDADCDFKIYGKISDVSETGANDVWHITNESGKEYLIPAIPSVVISVDIATDKVVIKPMKGIFDDED